MPVSRRSDARATAKLLIAGKSTVLPGAKQELAQAYVELEAQNAALVSVLMRLLMHLQTTTALYEAARDARLLLDSQPEKEI